MAEQKPKKPPLRWAWNLLFFLLTILTTFAAGAVQDETFRNQLSLQVGENLSGWAISFPPICYGFLSPLEWGKIFLLGLPFAGTLLLILLFHEFGHYFLARKHNINASLPFFIPMPYWIIGTMGAVIKMRSFIKSRDALLDVGAAGPLAGLVIAIPALFIGLSLSPVLPLPQGQYSQEGISLFYALGKYLVHGSIPAGSDVLLHPIAFAAWVGLFMTALNLLPIGQLDGGHIAYALFPKWHRRISQLVHGGLFLSVPLLILAGEEMPFSGAVFGVVIFLLMRDFGPRHPPVERSKKPLSPLRWGIGILCLVFFLILIPPVPLATITVQ